MATHSQNISNLENAVYGEQVRRSMIELFEEDYALVKKAIGYGTDIDSPTSSIAGYYDGNLYINSDTHDIWEMDGIGWHIVGNVLSIKDITVVESQIDDDNNVVTIQFTDGRTPLVFNVKNGKTGNGISSIDTIVSPDDDGINQVIINMTDGTSKSFSTKNGSKGSKGDKGDTGNPAGFGTPTATIDRNTGIPTVVVTASGSDETKVFNFDFKNLKGETGDKGDTGRGLDSITSIDSGKNHTLAANYSDGVSQVIATIKDGADGSGVGDMVKATYDTDDNGIVDKAEALFDVATGTTVPAKTILNKADKANTLVGYGITDAYTKVQVNAELDKKVNEPLAEGQDGYVLTTDGQGRREWKKGASDWNSLTDKPFETLGTDFEVKTVGEGDEEREELQLSTNVTDKLDTVGDIVEDGFYSR
ncbi:MAG: hypothetical protein KBT06_02995, partial [Prevotellaceae bacterium]|nr:hypothetical protein [Candidatus Colivivens equi]